MIPLEFSKDKAALNIILLAIAVKLAISPWATGDFQMPIGQIINYTCDGLVLFTVLLGFPSTSARFLYIYLIAILTGVVYAVSTLLFASEPLWVMFSTHLKIYLPLLAFPVLFRAYEIDPASFITAVKRVAMFAGLLLLIGLITLPNSMNRMEVWWPSYFGGLHSTAYIALMLVFIVYILMLIGELGGKLAVIVILTLSLCIYFGWGVRTATLAFFVFLIGVVITRVNYDRKSISQPVILFVLMLVIILVPLLSFEDGVLDKLTSGRLSMYAEKYDQLMKNSIAQWLLGNGYGSDIIESDVWWWEAKGAHSDIITMLVEGGVLYLVGFLVILYRLFIEGSNVFKCVLLAVLSTSLFSNGVFVRPIAGYLLTLIFVISFSRGLPARRKF